MQPRCSVVWLLCASAVLLCPRLAQADVEACIASHELGQTEENDGHLLKARDAFLACAAASCPSTIALDCASFLDRVEKNTPTMVFSANDQHGHDLSAVSVSLDDRVVLTHLTGRAIAIDPGSHRVRYTWADGQFDDLDLVAKEGEKNRRLSLAHRVHTQDNAVAPNPASGRRTAAYVLGGVGALALTSFTVFALSGYSKERVVDGCRPYCTQAQADAMHSRYLIADLSLGTALLAFGAASYLYFTSAPPSPVGSESVSMTGRTRDPSSRFAAPFGFSLGYTGHF